MGIIEGLNTSGTRGLQKWRTSGRTPSSSVPSESVRCAGADIVFRAQREIPINRSRGVGDFTARVMPAAIPRRLTGRTARFATASTFFNAQNFVFDINDVLRGVGFR